MPIDGVNMCNTFLSAMGRSSDIPELVVSFFKRNISRVLNGDFTSAGVQEMQEGELHFAGLFLFLSLILLIVRWFTLPKC